MSTNSKVLFGTPIAVLLVVLIFMPKLISNNIQAATVDNLYALFPPETQRQIEVEEQFFNSNWFTSTAQYNIRYTAFGSTNTIDVSMDFDYQHGPILFTANGLAIGLAHADIKPSFSDSALTEAFLDVPIELPQMNLNMLLGIDQSLELNLAIAASEISNEGITIDFDGLTAALTVAPTQSATFAMNMGQLEVLQDSNIDDELRFSIASLTLDSATAQIDDLLAPSTTKLSIPAVSASGGFDFTGTQLSAYSEISNTNTGAIDVVQNIAFAELDSELPLTAFDWTMELNELQVSVIRTYYDVLYEMQQQFSNPNNQDSDLMSEMLDSLGLVFLQNQLTINNSIAASAYAGDHSIDVNMKWLGIPHLATFEELRMDAILKALELQIDVSLQLDAINQSPAAQMIDPYLQQGYITVDNNRIELHLSLSNDQLVLNGEVTPLEQFVPITQ